MRFTLVCLVLAALGCGDDGVDQPPPREVVLDAAVEADGLSADVPFEIRGISGRTYPDPLDDTRKGSPATTHRALPDYTSRCLDA